MKRLVLTLFVMGTFSSGAFAQETQYGNCPTDPNLACQSFHGIYSVATGYCVYGMCFDMSSGNRSGIRVVAADELGSFPKTWFVWTDGLISPAPNILGCSVTSQGKKKVRVDIPEDQIRCLARLLVGTDIYVQHFASNPVSGCLAWLECTLPKVP
jgi:hypothetical protein